MRRSLATFLPSLQLRRYSTLFTLTENKMTGAQEQAGNQNDETADYFSRRATRHSPWTADLVTIDADEEHHDHPDDYQARNTGLLSPVQSDLLTPATLSPPAASTETSPLLPPSPRGYQYATPVGPVVCCRPGGRPADIPTHTNAPIFPNGPPQDLGGRPSWYEGRAEPDLERNKMMPLRRPGQKRRGWGSKYCHRWLSALGLLALLFLIQRLVMMDHSTDTSDIHNSHCGLPYCTEEFKHSFSNIDDFSLVDEMRPHPSTRINGKVLIKAAQEGQEADIIATISYGSSIQLELSEPSWVIADSALHLRLPAPFEEKSLLSSVFGSRLSVAVTLHLKSSMALASFSIATTHLAINSSPKLFDPNSSTNKPTIDTTKLTTSSTPIHLPHWTSRHTILKTSSSPITGSFTLLDLLAITSSSGSIAVSVDSGEADSSNPQPAQLRVHSSSGSVRVSTSTTSLHEREYRTDVDTQSGSIDGTFLLGADASFTTSSGHMDVDLLPYDSQARSSLRTRSSSAAMNINVLDAYKNGNEVFKGLRSSHISSGSGSIKVRYPGEWEGKIAVDTASGSINVRGDGVVIDEARQYGGHVRAHKGDGDCSIEARTSSASVDVLIG